MDRRLDAAELGRYLGDFRQRLFRMETLPAYTVDSDGDDYQRWLAGESEPTWERKTRWMDVLRRERAAGKVSSRVRVLSEQLTDYECYACEWGYALTPRLAKTSESSTAASTASPMGSSAATSGSSMTTR